MGVLASLLSLFGPGPAKADDGPLTRLREIHELVMDPNRQFSISRTLAELDTLAPEVEKTPVNSNARGELAYLRGFINYRAGRPQESVGPMAEANRIDAVAPFLTRSEHWRNIYDLATQARDLGDWPLALTSYEKAMPLLDADPEIDKDQRLGARQDWAYVLHEAGRFDEARKLNEYLLSEGEKLHGKDSYKLISVVINLAQNSHEMNDPAAARKWLDKYLAMASANGDNERIDDALFQLGVLSHETGKPDEARAFMKKRLELAKASGDLIRIEDAEDMIEELERRIATGEK